jgi:hypothetical protein
MLIPFVSLSNHGTESTPSGLREFISAAFGGFQCRIAISTKKIGFSKAAIAAGSSESIYDLRADQHQKFDHDSPAP